METGGPAVITENLSATIHVDGQHIGLGGLDHGLFLIHPVVLEGPCLDVRPVKAVNAVRIDGPRRGGDRFAIQQEVIADGHLIKADATIEAMLDSAAQVHRLRTIIPLVAQILQGRHYVIIGVERLFIEGLVLAARMSDQGATLEMGPANRDTQTPQERVIDLIIQARIALPSRLTGGIEARDNGASAAVLITDHTSAEAAISGNRTVDRGLAIGKEGQPSGDTNHIGGVACIDRRIPHLVVKQNGNRPHVAVPALAQKVNKAHVIGAVHDDFALIPRIVGGEPAPREEEEFLRGIDVGGLAIEEPNHRGIVVRARDDVALDALAAVANPAILHKDMKALIGGILEEEFVFVAGEIAQGVNNDIR